MKHVAIICSIAIASCVSLSRADEKPFGQLERMGYQVYTDVGSNVCTLDLYDREHAQKTAEERALKKDYPELFATKAVIAYWGAENCSPCRRQKAMLKSHVGTYNIVFYDVTKRRDAKLLTMLGHDKMVPQILIIEQGKKTAAFRGFTPWDRIKLKANKARKDKPIQFQRLNDRERGDLLKKLRDRTGDRWDNLRELLGGLRNTATEWVDITVAWVIENGDTIIRVVMLLFTLV